MDQTNPLRSSQKKAFSPRQQSFRNRAGFEFEIFTTATTAVCVYRNSEGPNIGLISYLTACRINKYGFIEAPSEG